MNLKLATVVNSIAGVVLGGTLLVAGVLKSLDPVAFASQIESEGLALFLPAGAWAVLMIAVEVGLGAALVLGHRQRWLLAATSALVAFFLFLTGRSWWRWSRGELDEDAACGCFGTLVERTPAEAFAQDLLLLLPALVLLWLLWKWSPKGLWRWLAPALAVVAGAFAVAAPDLPLDDLATRLRPGVRFDDLCAGGDEPAERACIDLLVPELAAGDHWVVMSDLDNPELVESVGKLNQALIDGTSVWLLTPDEQPAIQTFLFTAGPSFPVREVPATLLRPFYRTLPRSFRIVDGVVTETQVGVMEVTPSPDRAE